MLFVFSLIFVRILKISSLKNVIVKDEVGSWLTRRTSCLIFWTTLLYIKKKKKKSNTKNGLMEPPPLKHKKSVIFHDRPPISLHVSDGSLGFCSVYVPSIVFDNVYLSLPRPHFGAWWCADPVFAWYYKCIPKSKDAVWCIWAKIWGMVSVLEHHWVFVSQFFWWLSWASLYTNFDELWMSALMSDYCYRVSLHTNFDVPWMSVSIVWLLLQELQFVVDRYAEEAKTWRQKEETLLKRINVSSNVSFICYSYSVWVSKWTFLCYINVGSNVTFVTHILCECPS